MESTAMYFYLGVNKGLHPLDPENIHGGRYETVTVSTEEEAEELMADGWRFTTMGAFAAAQPASETEVIEIVTQVETLRKPGRPKKVIDGLA